MNKYSIISAIIFSQCEQCHWIFPKTKQKTNEFKRKDDYNNSEAKNLQIKKPHEKQKRRYNNNNNKWKK